VLTLALGALCVPGCDRTPAPEARGTSLGVADPGPETSRAPAPAVFSPPAQTRADRVAWRARLQWPAECEEAFETSAASASSGLDVHELGDGVLLVQVRCAAGAYQPSSLVMYVDETRTPSATTMTFQTYVSPDGERLERVDTSELWGEVSVAGDGHALTVLNLSRQTADCGTWTEYTLAKRTPTLVALYARLPCPTVPDAPVDPAPGQPPADWKRMDVQ
jgi:hypothetical protein